MEKDKSSRHRVHRELEDRGHWWRKIKVPDTVYGTPGVRGQRRQVEKDKSSRRRLHRELEDRGHKWRRIKIPDIAYTGS